MVYTFLNVLNTSDSVAVNESCRRGISYLAPMSVVNVPSRLPCAISEGDR